MILLIDNVDSFVYNLARYVRELGEEPVVRRSDTLTVAEVERLAPTHVILSPGPCSPAEATLSTDVVRELGARVPILGVCLGHQCIGAAYGGDIVRAVRPLHGKVSRIRHDGTSVFAGLPSPLRATRYHSLVIRPASLPDCLRVTATSDEGEIMGVQHRVHPVVGVQFHPESALTDHGYRMLDRFLHGDRPGRAPLPQRADLAAGPAAPPDEYDAPAFVAPPVEIVR
ncbi:MAG TPA: aminodeoxychorismate/anthranilate synthase component II [Gemmatimonadaceae bacterium]|nr:aminodeoxychorismate/anthranilate synthase component II [Gemmatimonadaceae bacterium]